MSYILLTLDFLGFWVLIFVSFIVIFFFFQLGYLFLGFIVLISGFSQVFGVSFFFCPPFSSLGSQLGLENLELNPIEAAYNELALLVQEESANTQFILVIQTISNNLEICTKFLIVMKFQLNFYQIWALIFFHYPFSCI